MPKKAKRPCRYKGCPKLVDSESGYCAEHEKAMSRYYDRYVRSSEHNKRYGYRWKKIRTMILNTNPFCELCKAEGKYTLATEVHHIKPLSKGGGNDLENLMALCKSCHAKIHRHAGMKFEV